MTDEDEMQFVFKRNEKVYQMQKKNEIATEKPYIATENKQTDDDEWR